MGRPDRKPPRLKYLHQYRDKTGRVRRYFRRGTVSIALPGEIGTEEFSKAYLAAFGEAPKARGGAGSIDVAVTGYLGSRAFKAMAVASRKMRRNILDRFREEYGAAPVNELRRDHIDKILAKKMETPPAAKNLLKTLRGFLDWCVAEKLLKDNPSNGVKVKVPASSGFYTWSEDDITRFEGRHPIGSRPRLALALLLYTAQRRADVVLMGRQHIRDGALFIRQQKTGMELSIPLHPELKAALDATPSGQLTFLVTSFGHGFTAAGFTNWFREQCRAAGLPLGVSAHGLRKAACRRLAEAGCSAHEIAAISGHATLAEVQRYTKAADQKRMARSAMETVTAAFKVANRNPR
jgi:integrase